MKKILLVIAGPTASGKTSLAIDLALHFKTEIVSADSRQFYQEMEIGTAKPFADQLQQVRHHFINSHSITESVNAGMYAASCRALLHELFQKYTLVLMAGGSGLFIDAVIDGMDELPAANEEIRLKLHQDFQINGIRFLQEQLFQLDPVTYQKIDLANVHRLMRALEVCMLTGKPYSSFLTGTKQPVPFTVVYICIDVPRNVLYDSINFRVDQMITNGLLKEVESLLDFKNLPAMQTVGYRELVQYLEGSISFPEAVVKIKQHSRNYAKRQVTWFKKRSEVIFMNPSQIKEIIELVEKTRNES